MAIPARQDGRDSGGRRNACAGPRSTMGGGRAACHRDSIHAALLQDDAAASCAEQPDMRQQRTREGGKKKIDITVKMMFPAKNILK